MKKQTNCKRSKIVVASKERKGSVLYKSVQKSLRFGNSVSKLRHTSESSISHNTLFLNSWTFNIRTRISICPWIQVKNTNKWSQYWYNTRRQELRDKTIQNKYTDLESKVWHEIRLVLQRLVCWPFYSRSPAVCWWEGPSVVKGSVSVCVCVSGEGKGWWTSLSISSWRGLPSRWPINRLKDKSVRKKWRTLCFLFQWKKRKKRGIGGDKSREKLIKMKNKANISCYL